MALYSWYDLSWREQCTVVRLARQGRKHPDAEVARVADEWAREKLGLDSAGRGSIGQMILGALLGDGASLGQAWRDRRKAELILRVSSGGR